MRSSTAREIGFGYTIAIGLGFTGTIAGMLLADYWQGKGIAQLVDAQEQSQILDQFQVSAHNVHMAHLHLTAATSQADQFREELRHLNDAVADAAKAEQDLEDLLGREPAWVATDIESMNAFLQRYRQELQIHEAQIQEVLQRYGVNFAPSNVSGVGNSAIGNNPVAEGDTLLALQADLLALEQLDAYKQLSDLHDELLSLIGIAQQQELQGGKDMEAAQGVEKLIIMLSALGSVAIAGLVAFRTTKGFVHPLKEINATTHKVIDQADFTLRVSVEPQNNNYDMEELARSFNKLIQWVNEYTQQLNATVEDLKQTQSQLVQTEKMSSLGQLVAGISHEINNPVGFVSGNITYIERYINDLLYIQQLYQTHFPYPPAEIADAIEQVDLEFLKADSRQLIQSIEAGSERIRDIVASLSNFARLNQSGMKYVDVHKGLESALMLLQYRFNDQPHRPAIKLDRQYGHLPQVYCDPGALNQVFMHLLTNAIDAIDECWYAGASVGAAYQSSSLIQSAATCAGSAGQDAAASQRTAEDTVTRDSRRGLTADTTATVATTTVTSDRLQGSPKPGIIRVSTTVRDRFAIEVEIADNGCGITHQLCKQIFDPFFTTKPVGKGAGLGLSVSYQIITQIHRGQITCESTPGEGSCFKVTLPLGS